MYDIRRVTSGRSDTERAQALMETCFPDSNVFSLEYMDWLYKKNPAGPVVGCNAMAGGELAAHYVTVPALWNYKGRTVRGLLSLNTATHPNHQRKGLFVKLAEATYETGSEEGFSFVVGVANQNSTHGFVKKLGFELVDPLEAKITLGVPKDGENLNQLKTLTPLWSEEFLNWRLSRPGTNYWCKKSKSGYFVFSKTSKPLMSACLGHFSSLPVDLPEKSHLGATVWIGYHSLDHCKGNLNAKFPEFLKPSPLNLIYKPLQKEFEGVSPKDLAFQCIDFDAY